MMWPLSHCLSDPSTTENKSLSTERTEKHKTLYECHAWSRLWDIGRDVPSARVPDSRSRSRTRNIYHSIDCGKWTHHAWNARTLRALYRLCYSCAGIRDPHFFGSLLRHSAWQLCLYFYTELFKSFDKVCLLVIASPSRIFNELLRVIIMHDDVLDKIDIMMLVDVADKIMTDVPWTASVTVWPREYSNENRLTLMK